MASEINKAALLFVSSNDGSDMRITKEVQTLSRAFDVHFLGIGDNSDRSFARSYSTSFVLIPGSARSSKTIAKLIANVIRARRKLSPVSIHVINEQLLTATWPAYLGQRVVLDVFDSVFLRLNKPGNSWWFIKWILYSHASRVIVTDEYRKDLLASFVKPRAVVIPNVPFKTQASTIMKRRNGTLTLAYFGSLAENRGTAFVRNLLKFNPGFRVLCAGWPADESSRQLMELPAVTNLGVMTQAEANEIIAREVDYIVSIYPRGNLNNYYASPNKLYDAIHTRTPLIIGDNVKVSEFVAENGLGIVVNETQLADPATLGSLLLEKREDFNITSELSDRFCWENFEDTLIDVHRRNL
ncbi:hypothetical protein V6767_18965 [Martelella sp. FLE1502]